MCCVSIESIRLAFSKNYDRRAEFPTNVKVIRMIHIIFSIIFVFAWIGIFASSTSPMALIACFINIIIATGFIYYVESILCFFIVYTAIVVIFPPILAMIQSEIAVELINEMTGTELKTDKVQETFEIFYVIACLWILLHAASVVSTYWVLRNLNPKKNETSQETANRNQHHTSQENGPNKTEGDKLLEKK